jgi:hypothetical protein
LNFVDLADGWIRLQDLASDSPEAARLAEDGMDLVLLALSEPELCWRVILEILRRPIPEKRIADLGSGPLESLLSHHGETVLRWIEAELPGNPSLKRSLCHVWQNLMSDALYRQVRALLD